jgi:hypothetical protein
MERRFRKEKRDAARVIHPGARRVGPGNMLILATPAKAGVQVMGRTGLRLAPQ